MAIVADRKLDRLTIISKRGQMHDIRRSDIQISNPKFRYKEYTDSYKIYYPMTMSPTFPESDVEVIASDTNGDVVVAQRVDGINTVRNSGRNHRKYTIEK